MIASRLGWNAIFRGIGLLALTSQLANAGDPKVTIQAGAADLVDTPIVVETSKSIAPGHYRLLASDGESIPSLVYLDKKTAYLGFILPKTHANSLREFHLEPTKIPTDPDAGVRLAPGLGATEVIVAGKSLTTYRTDIGPKPIYYPVIGPTGLPITRDYPMKDMAKDDHDHPHHRSLWFTHGNVNGVDFWSEAKGHGSIEETAKLTMTAGPALGVIRTADTWRAADGKVVCTDERLVRFYDTKLARVFDFDITISADHGPLTFGDTKEGTFGLRIASVLDAKPPGTGKVVNAEGLTNDDAWGKPSRWVDYSGIMDGKAVGVAIFNHPESFRYPTTWHVRTYGLFAANPFGYKDFGIKGPGEYTVPAGESISFRYRLILHEGEISATALNNAFQSYAEPPKVTVDGG